MSFSGKKFKRVRSEKIHELCCNGQRSISEEVLRILTSSSPIISYTVAGRRLLLIMQAGDRFFSQEFELDVESDLVKRDGSKIKIKYILESEDILLQIVKFGGGKIVRFRREFYGSKAKMTVQASTSDVIATIYYEEIN